MYALDNKAILLQSLSTHRLYKDLNTIYSNDMISVYPHKCRCYYERLSRERPTVY